MTTYQDIFKTNRGRLPFDCWPEGVRYPLAFVVPGGKRGPATWYNRAVVSRPDAYLKPTYDSLPEDVKVYLSPISTLCDRDDPGPDYILTAAEPWWLGSNGEAI